MVQKSDSFITIGPEHDRFKQLDSKAAPVVVSWIIPCDKPTNKLPVEQDLNSQHDIYFLFQRATKNQDISMRPLVADIIRKHACVFTIPTNISLEDYLKELIDPSSEGDSNSIIAMCWFFGCRVQIYDDNGVTIYQPAVRPRYKDIFLLMDLYRLPVSGEYYQEMKLVRDVMDGSMDSVMLQEIYQNLKEIKEMMQDCVMGQRR